MTSVIPRPQQIFSKAVLGCFRLDTFAPYSFQGDKRQCKTGVAVEPEQQGDVKGCLRESVAGSAHLGGTTAGSAGTSDGGEGGVSDVGQLGGVTDHLVVTLLLLRGEGQLVPDVHPVTILTVNALTADLDLNLGNELLTGEIQPAGIDAIRSRDLHALVDLREGDLEVCAECHITVTGNGACHAATEIGLTRECLFDALKGKVCVAAVRYLPESDFGCSSKENVLCAVGDQLHECSSHFGSV